MLMIKSQDRTNRLGVSTKSLQKGVKEDESLQDRNTSNASSD